MREWAFTPPMKVFEDQLDGPLFPPDIISGVSKQLAVLSNTRKASESSMVATPYPTLLLAANLHLRPEVTQLAQHYLTAFASI